MAIQGHSRSSVSMSMKIKRMGDYILRVRHNNFCVIYELWKDIATARSNKKYFRLSPIYILLAHCFSLIPIEFGETGNSAIRSADPENPVLEPNTE